MEEGGGQIIVLFLNRMAGREWLRRQLKKSLTRAWSFFLQSAAQIITLISNPNEPQAKGKSGPETKHRHRNPVLRGPSTRTLSIMEEKKNICQSSKCFNYPTPTQGSFGNCPWALQSANQGPCLAKHLNTCTISHAWVAARNYISLRDLLAFSLTHRCRG